MTLEWTDFPDAPSPGSFICELDAIPSSGLLSLPVGDFPVLVSRSGGEVRVFVNACPHQYLPLDRRGSILSADGERLMCSNHQAEFDRVTGAGVAGHGSGCALSVVPVTISGNALQVAANAAQPHRCRATGFPPPPLL